MDVFQIALTLGILALFAHILKGLTGFGPAIVFVSIGSVIKDPVEIIVLASFLDVIGGGYLSILNPEFLQNKDYWGPVGLLMITGAVLGSLTLSLLPPTVFKYLLGAAIILVSLWFLSGKLELSESSESLHEIGVKDGLVGVFSGFSGGFTGMGGPPLVAYLGTKLNKESFRAIVVPIFLMAAIARISTYTALGMLPTNNPWLYIFPPAGVILGNYLGNQFFESVEQKRFTIIVGIILMLSGIRVFIG